MCLTSSTEQKLNQQTAIFFWYITWDFDEYTKSYVIVFFLDSWDSFSSRWARRLPFNLSCIFSLWQLLEKPLFCWQRNTFIYFVSVEHELISRPLGWNDFVKKKKKRYFKRFGSKTSHLHQAPCGEISSLEQKGGKLTKNLNTNRNFALGPVIHVALCFMKPLKDSICLQCWRIVIIIYSTQMLIFPSASQTLVPRTLMIYQNNYSL